MFKRCLAVAALTLVFDAAIAAYYLAISRDWYTLALVTTALCPFLLLLSRGWFADEPTLRGRVWLTVAEASGAVCATALVLWAARYVH